MTKAEKELWIDEYTKLYEEGRAIRGLHMSRRGEYCAVGVAMKFQFDMVDLRGARLIPIVAANDSGAGSVRDKIGTLVTPAGFAEAVRLIKELPTTD